MPTASDLRFKTGRFAAAALLTASCAFAQNIDPFPQPINTTEGVIRAGIVEFARLPDAAGEPARMMLLVDEPATRRLFVNEMRGPLYTVSYDGRTVTPYLDTNDPQWGVNVQSQGTGRGFHSFALHPEFGRAGARGYGKLYTYIDTSNMTPTPDFLPAGGNNTHDTVLLEWTATNPAAATYDGGPPRELFRVRDPFLNHNGGHASFNPLARPGTPDYGLLYFGLADGGSAGDPFNNGQNLATPFAKILRIDPLGSNSANGKYGIPPSNPFVSDNNPQTLGEIYAYGVRNPQRFAWDPKNGNIFAAEIGQNEVEEVSLVTPGANLGWNQWEGSFRFVSPNAITLDGRRGDPKITYPVVEYDHKDPLFASGVATTGVVVYRGRGIPQLANLVLFGDNPTGEVFYFSADRLPDGGQGAIRRVLFNSGGSAKTLLQLIKEKNPSATRADLRFGTGPNDRIFLLNKQDGTIREIVR